MGITYYGSRISPNMTKTKEGYLICTNVPLARTGDQIYLARELQLSNRNPNEEVIVHKDEDELFDPATIASFEGKPFTDNHPEKDVELNNHATYYTGHCQNVHRGTGKDSDKLIGDIYVTNPTVIDEIENGKRQISCGYICEYIDNGDGTYSQARIRGNHIALVDEGRAGRNISIKDSKTKERRTHEMSNTITGKIKSVLNLLTRSVRDSKSEDDTQEMVCDAGNAIENIIATHEDTKEVNKEKEVETKDSATDDNTAVRNALLTASIALNEAIAYLGKNNETQPAQVETQPAPQPEAPKEEAIPEPTNEEPSETPEESEFQELKESTDDGTKEPLDDEEENLEDKDTMDSLYEELTEDSNDEVDDYEEDIEEDEIEEDYDESEDYDEEPEEEDVEEEVYTEDEDSEEVVESEEIVSPDGFTKDSIAKFVKDMKPIIARISNDRERAIVTDAFVKKFKNATKDSNSLIKIMNANKSFVESKVMDSKPITTEDIQNTFDALNPHKKH